MARTLELLYRGNATPTPTDVYTVPAGSKVTVREITCVSLSGLLDYVTVLLAGKYYRVLTVPGVGEVRADCNGVLYAGEKIRVYNNGNVLGSTVYASGIVIAP